MYPLVKVIVTYHILSIVLELGDDVQPIIQHCSIGDSLFLDYQGQQARWTIDDITVDCNSVLISRGSDYTTYISIPELETALLVSTAA
jgi:hypothetical protein